MALSLIAHLYEIKVDTLLNSMVVNVVVLIVIVAITKFQCCCCTHIYLVDFEWLVITARIFSVCRFPSMNLCWIAQGDIYEYVCSCSHHGLQIMRQYVYTCNLIFESNYVVPANNTFQIATVQCNTWTIWYICHTMQYISNVFLATSLSLVFITFGFEVKERVY